MLFVNGRGHYASIEVDRDGPGAAMTLFPACGERLTKVRLGRRRWRSSTVIRELSAADTHVLDCLPSSGDGRVPAIVGS